MVSTSISTNTDFVAVVTTTSFLDGVSWINVSDPRSSIVSRLQHNTTGNLRRLDIPKCIKTYNQEFIADWRNVLLVSDTTELADSRNSSGSDSVIEIATLSNGKDLPDRFCAVEFKSGCTAERIIQTQVWSLQYPDGNAGYDQIYVQACLAERMDPHCKVTFNVFMLFISVICNAAKAATFLLLLFLSDFKPLITIGDAIASFLTHPDRVTARVGAPAIGKDGAWLPPILSTPWKSQRCKWFCGASSRQWLVGILS